MGFNKLFNVIFKDASKLGRMLEEEIHSVELCEDDYFEFKVNGTIDVSKRINDRRTHGKRA